MNKIILFTLVSIASLFIYFNFLQNEGPLNQALDPDTTIKDTASIKHSISDPLHKKEEIQDSRFKDCDISTISSEEFRKRIRYEFFDIKGISHLKVHKSDGTADQIYAVIDKGIIHNIGEMEQLVNDVIITYKNIIGDRTSIRFMGSVEITDAMHRDDYEFIEKNKTKYKNNYLGYFSIRLRQLETFPDMERKSKTLNLTLSKEALTILSNNKE